MKKVFFVLIALSLIISSCSLNKKNSADNVMKDSLWVNLTPATMGNEEGVIINSLYFTSDDKVFMKTGVGQGSEVIAKPIFSGYGTYTCSGNLKKGIIFNINTQTSTIGKKMDYKGLITSEGMILIEPDSTAYIYYQIQPK